MEYRFPHLFSPVTLGTLQLKNRIVRSATFEAKADAEGHPTKLYIDLYRRLSAGGVGLIITGLAYPDKNGKFPGMLGVDDDNCLTDLAQIPGAVHDLKNSCKIALQLAHAGRQLPESVERERVGPSPIHEPYTGRTPRELTFKEIESIIDAFAAAIERARKTGFDAVQLHAAHGWLLSSFLSPHTNKRKDTYGGCTDNRARIMTEIIRRAQRWVGKDYPVFVKMNARDFVEDGIELPESVILGKIFEEAGYAALETSSCMWETITRDPAVLGWNAEPIPESRKRINTVEDEAYHREYSRAFKENLKKARIILVGGLKTPALMDEIIAKGDADMVALSRPLIREPELPLMWQNGSDLRSQCVSCNNCLETLSEERGLRCKLK